MAVYDYTTAGFDKFLTRGVVNIDSTTEDDTSAQITQLSGTSIASGVTTSQTGKMVARWNDEEFYVTDGARKRVQIGNFDKTGVYGLRVIDSVGNIRLESSSDRNFSDIEGRKVVVGTEGDDYTDIQKALDYIHGLGGGTVFVKRGTYSITATINLYENIHLVGEDKVSTILNFSNPNDTGMEVSSTSFFYNTGTIAMGFGTNTITGTGTSWLTQLSAGDSIFIYGAEYTISSVNTNTSLTLTEDYRGRSMSGVSYAAGNFSENISIENLTFNDLSIDISMVKNFTVKNIEIDGKPLSVLNSFYGSVIDCTIKNSTSYGVLVYNSNNVVFDYCRSFNNRNAGFYIITGNQGIVFRHCAAISNLTHGFYVGGAATILQCIANINVVNGINCTSGLVGDSIISGNILTYNGSYGIAINTSLQTGLPITGNYTYGSGYYGLYISSADFNGSAIVGNIFADGISANNDTNRIEGNNFGESTLDTGTTKRMKNDSGSTLTEGMIVKLVSSADGDEVTTTTAAGDNKVFGVVIGSITDGNYGWIQTIGKTVNLKVDGTTDIAVGDFLGTFTTAGICQKAASTHTAIAIALEAYTTDDSNGIIDALLIPPRYIA